MRLRTAFCLDLFGRVEQVPVGALHRPHRLSPVSLVWIARDFDDCGQHLPGPEAHRSDLAVLAR